MQVFRCPACGGMLWFHNATCACGQNVTFDPETQDMVANAAACANRTEIACNWRAEQDGLCRSCAMTATVPDLREAENLPLWQRTEEAKRWVLANLMRWGWFTLDDPGARPVFRLLSEHTAEGDAPVTMGHASGEITINVSEASDAELVRRQAEMGELYRTMIGHMRHELAHFLFERLSSQAGFLDTFRARFGDERADYAEALKAHYAQPRDKGQTHVTTYATAHPHEDWAETIAHLLHLTDLLDSAAASGLALPEGPPRGYDAYAESDTGRLLTLAIDLTLAINHVNRALEIGDLYPFVLAQPVRDKLHFAHDALRKR
ncbi:zinc-binding metallopeptidase family protein [Sagittula salina]|uniref:Zinc-binding metallopeptidase n=1 Tax=Sagittula salina TaxID=2820268 RepID=A0A940MNF9_9RHOB|nr:putative zinc-binding metallopeptidase [Sagittula salina]MBP0485125.1 putative zinc-binding metallopeptidase [Sagittula salina]